MQCFIIICILFLLTLRIIVIVYGCDSDSLVWLHGFSSYVTTLILLFVTYDTFSESTTNSSPPQSYLSHNQSSPGNPSQTNPSTSSITSSWPDIIFLVVSISFKVKQIFHFVPSDKFFSSSPSYALIILILSIVVFFYVLARFEARILISICHAQFFILTLLFFMSRRFLLILGCLCFTSFSSVRLKILSLFNCRIPICHS